MRTVGNWERGDTSPAQKESALRTALADYFDQAQKDHVSLRSASDAELLGEIARRFARTPEAESTATSSRTADDRAPTAVEPDDPEDYELAASHGDEGIAPDELPESGP